MKKYISKERREVEKELLMYLRNYRHALQTKMNLIN